MNKNKTFLLTLFLSAAPLWVGLLLYSRLPAQLPSHWNFLGQADGYSDKNAIIFGMSAFLAFIHLGVMFALRVDPKSKRIPSIAFNLSLWILPVISVLVTVLIYGTSLGIEFSVTRIMMLVICIMFLIIGNYLPKIRQNYTVGIRTPWTLNDENNWDATHRFGGRLMVVCCLVSLPFILFDHPMVVLILLLISALGSVIYSFLYYRNHSNGDS